MWYWPTAEDRIVHTELPLAATVVYVSTDGRLVNLAVFDTKGKPFGRLAVPVKQPDQPELVKPYAEWPYRTKP